MSLLEKAGSYGKKYRGHHLKSGVHFKEKKLSEHRLHGGKVIRNGELDADYE